MKGILLLFVFVCDYLVAFSTQELMLNNPLVTSASELGRRIGTYEKIRQYALQSELAAQFAQNNFQKINEYLEDEPELRDAILSFKLAMAKGDLTAAQNVILNIPAVSSDVWNWGEDGKKLLYWMSNVQPYGRYSAIVRDDIEENLEPRPQNENYTNNKYFYGEFGVFPMYMPKPSSNRSVRQHKENHSKQEPLVYPNPANGYLRIDYEMKEGEWAFYRLYDITGKLVVEQKFNSHHQPALIVLPELIAGMYAWQIGYDNKVSNGKLEVR